MQQIQLSSEDVNRYVRIGLQWTASALVTYGAIAPGATWVEPAIGGAVGLASLLWTIYGNRVNAKLAEIAKIISPDGSKFLVVTDAATAASVTAPNVVPPSAVKMSVGAAAAVEPDKK